MSIFNDGWVMYTITDSLEVDDQFPLDIMTVAVDSGLIAYWVNVYGAGVDIHRTKCLCDVDSLTFSMMLADHHQMGMVEKKIGVQEIIDSIKLILLSPVPLCRGDIKAKIMQIGTDSFDYNADVAGTIIQIALFGKTVYD